MNISDHNEPSSDLGADHPPEVPPLARTLRWEIGGYALGLLLALGLTAASFWAATTPSIYGPGVALALLVLAVAQMGIHLVFFLHLTTAPDNANNILALAFGVLIVSLIVFGSVWVMIHLTHNMAPMSDPVRATAIAISPAILTDLPAPLTRTERYLPAGSQ